MLPIYDLDNGEQLDEFFPFLSAAISPVRSQRALRHFSEVESRPDDLHGLGPERRIFRFSIKARRFEDDDDLLPGLAQLFRRRDGGPMKRFNTTKQLCILMSVVLLGMLSILGIALAQSSEEGIANFYSDRFQGKKTASGQVYDKNALTASHKKHPFGTKVKVTNIESGKDVVVTVTDRMGRKNPAVIDVTRRAADELGFTKAGKARVKLDVVQ